MLQDIKKIMAKNKIKIQKIYIKNNNSTIQ